MLYTVGLVLSLWLAYQLRFDFNLPPIERGRLWDFALWILPLKLGLLLLIGQFAGLLSYFSVPDLRRLTLALVTAALMLMGVWLSTETRPEGAFAPPRSVILADFVLSLLFISSIRLLCRLTRERYFSARRPKDVRVQRVGIVGAGYAGATLARELFIKRNLGLRPVCFFDDNRDKWRKRLHDIPVIGAPEMLLQAAGKKLKLDRIVIAMPSAGGRRIREIVKILQQASLKFETVPSLDQLADGRVKVTQFRPVAIEDLLGREPVQLEKENIRGILENEVVMVTGAGGSIGSELCRQIAAFRPKRLLLVEQSEVQIFQIEQELLRLGFEGLVVPLVADVLDHARMNVLFRRFRPGVVFHAAAHKHVPMMEYHPGEAIKNNTLGTARVADLAARWGVRRFVLISTDKAINPTSVMGATKRLAEIYVQALAAARGTQTQFMAVRFGNVLGSSGSVVPMFKQQIAAGGPVTVTDPEVTRYFMTIPEAVGLVLQSAAQGQGGEIFILNMGKPVKILDLARQLIELSGFTPGVDIEIQFTGLRPGEKLYEELLHTSEECVPTQHPEITRLLSRPVAIDSVQEALDTLAEGLDEADADELKLLLKKAVPEYQPYLGATNAPARTPSGVPQREPVPSGS